MECGAVLPAKLSAGNVANGDIGLLDAAFQRAIINNSGLAHWFPLDPGANWIILGTRRTAMAWVYTMYIGGFHMLHYPRENLQRRFADFQIEQREDTNAPFDVHGRRQAWNLFYGICGKHLQGFSTVRVGGISVQNPDYYGDEDGGIRVRFGRFMRNMCYEEAPFFPDGDECITICRKACAWQAPQLPMDVVMLGGQRD